MLNYVTEVLILCKIFSRGSVFTCKLCDDVIMLGITFFEMGLPVNDVKTTNDDNIGEGKAVKSRFSKCAWKIEKRWAINILEMFQMVLCPNDVFSVAFSI